MAQYSTLEAVLRDRADRGMSEILDEIYASAYAAGAGIPDPTPHRQGMRELLWLLADRHRAEHPPIMHDELPGWLLSLANQKESP